MNSNGVPSQDVEMGIIRQHRAFVSKAFLGSLRDAEQELEAARVDREARVNAEKESLLGEIAALRQENNDLRCQLAARTHNGGAEHQKEQDQIMREHAIAFLKESTNVSREAYNALLEKYQRLERRALRERDMGGTYQKAFFKLKEQYDRAKSHVKSWQDYHDRLRRPPPTAVGPIADQQAKSGDESTDAGALEAMTTAAANGHSNHSNDTAILLPDVPPVLGNGYPMTAFAELRDILNEPISSPRPQSSDSAKSSTVIMKPPEISNNEQVETATDVIADQPNEALTNDTLPSLTYGEAHDSMGSEMATRDEGTMLSERNNIPHAELCEIGAATGNEPRSSAYQLLQLQDEYPYTGSLKRKRSSVRLRSAPTTTADVEQPGSSEQPVVVNEESNSIDLTALLDLPHDESMDLDDVFGNIDTPRKRRAVGQLLRGLNNDDRHREYNETLNQSKGQVLQPLDPNATMLRKVPRTDSRKEFLDLTCIKTTSSPVKSGPTKRAKHGIERPSVPLTSENYKTRRVASPRAMRKSLQSGEVENEGAHSFTTDPTLSKNAAELVGIYKKTKLWSEHKRLRQQPLSLLRLDDFKVNPAFNQGYDYAFTEVVRDRDKRRCLPGCTRPDCCGKSLTKVLELGGAAGAGARHLWDSSQTAEDEILLRRYFGDGYEPLKTATAEERQEMIQQARTEEFSKKYGKHKQAYQREKTPPGFWRTDFPTTQEVKEDREKARKEEQRQLNERYVEALRPHGRWLFRDE